MHARFATAAPPLVLMLMLLIAAGCGGERRGLGDDPQLTPSEVAWSAILHAHNQRVSRIDQMWSRAVVELRWVDEDGDRQFEQGDGPLILRKPGRTALAIGKLGKTRFWLGSDRVAYWLFDLDDPRLAYFGRVDHAEPLHVDDDYPMPVRPDRLIGLLGLLPLPARPDDPPAVFDLPNGHRQVTLPEPDLKGDWTRRLRFDPSHRLSEIAWLAPDGTVAISVLLSNYKSMAMESGASVRGPEVPARVRLDLPQREASADLFLSQMQSGEAKITDRQFDFQHLLDALDIERIALLDEQAPTDPPPHAAP